MPRRYLAPARRPYQDPIQPDDRESKLPVWAQDVITSLRNRVHAAEDAAEEARLATDPQGSKIRLWRPFPAGHVGLGSDARVDFVIDPDAGCHFAVELDDDELVVLSLGGGGLLVRPRVSNSVALRLDR